MKLWLRNFYVAALIFMGVGAVSAQSLSPTGISASPASVLPGDTVTFTISVANGGTQFSVGGTASFTIVLTHTVSGATVTLATGSIAPTSGFIAAATTDPATGQQTPGTGSFTYTGAIPTKTTEAGTYRATVTLNSVSTGSVGTSQFSVSSTVLTVTGKPDLQITGLTYSASTSYVGGTIIPMTVTYVNNQQTNGTQNVPYTPNIAGMPQFVRLEVVLSTNPNFGDADDFLLTFHDIAQGNFGSNSTTDNAPGGGNPAILADGSSHTFSWNQILPGNFSGSYYVLAKIDTLNRLSQNDPGALTVNGNNVWIGNSGLNPSGTLINLLPTNFPTTYLATHASGASSSASGYSDNPSISADGRYVAFASDSTNLVSGDTNSVRDIFVYDNQTTLVRRLSVSQQGFQSNAASNNPAISGNGRYVAFGSDATNLVIGDSNGFSDIFVVDTLTGLITRLSGANAAGGQANNPSFRPSMSQDGRYVVFQSTATNLVPGLTTVTGRSHIYLHDRDVAGTGTFDTAGNTSTLLVDSAVSAPATAEGNGDAIQATISPDGSWIAFASKASNLVATATTASRQHVYVRPRANVGTATSGIKLISVVNGGPATAEGNADSQTPSLSSNGRYVAFASLADNLVTGDTNAVSDIFVYDNNQPEATPIVRRMSVANGTNAQAVDPSPAAFALGSINPTISADGRYVAFASLANNLTTGDIFGQAQAADANNAIDIFVRDRDSTASGTFDTVATATTMVSMNPFGHQTGGLLGIPSTAASNIYPVISANGRFVAFPTDSENIAGLAFGATNRISLDLNGFRDVFLYDRRTDASVTPATPPTVTITSPGSTGTSQPPLVNTAITVRGTATTNVGVVANVQFFVNGTSLGTSTVFPYTQTWTPTAVGTYTLSALVTDSFGNVGVSPNVSVTVVAAPSVGVTSPAPGTSITAGTTQTITATAAASNPGATIAGVQFYTNGALLGTVTSAPYSWPWTPGSAGAYSLYAIAVDSIGTQSTSPTVGVTVVAAGGGGTAGIPPTISLASPGNGSTVSVNRPVTVTASAGSAKGTVTKVDFFANGGAIGTSSTYPYAVNWTPVTPGTYALTAVATDSNLLTSTSTTTTVTVATGTPPSVSLTSPAAGSVVSVNSPREISATATSATGLIASVQFYVNGTVLLADTTFPYSATWTPTALGNYTIVARATDSVGNVTDSAITTVSVTSGSAPAVAMTNPTAGGSYALGTALNLAANAVDADGLIAQVAFFVNGQAQGTADSVAPYSTPWTPTAAGSYNITAQATDNSGNVTTSLPLTLTVVANGAPSVAILSPGTGSTASTGIPVSLTASASDVDGTVSGVRYFVNGNVVGAVAATAPYLTVWTPSAAGNYTIVAEATDNTGNIATSSPRTVTVVANKPPTVALTSPSSGISVPSNLPVGLAALASDEDGTVANVRFLVNNNLIGSAIAAAPFSTAWTPTTAGTYSIVAEATDNSGNITTSTARTVTVVANQFPVVALANPRTAFSSVAGVAVGLAATAVDNDGTITRVRFLVNGNAVGAPATSAPYSANWTPTAAGTYSIVVEATDDVGNVSNSTPVVATITANQLPSVAFTAPTNGSVIRIGTPTSLAVTASDADGTVANVTFLVNGTVVGTPVTTFPYKTSWTPTAEGIYRVTATATDNAGGTSFSSTVTVLIVGSQGGSDNVYTGLIVGGAESGTFAAVNIRGKTAAFIGTSTVNGSAKNYFFSGLPVSTGGTFAGSGGGRSISGGFSDTGAFGTLEGNISFSGAITSAGATAVAAGYYTGNFAGKTASLVNAIVGPDGSIMVYMSDGSFQAVATGAVDSTGAFTAVTGTGVSLAGKADPATGFLTGTLTGGPGGFVLGAISSGASFGDGTLRNLSTRGQVGSGGNVLIAGFYVAGTSPKQVLIRAVGPTIGAAPYNLPGALSDPQLQVYNSQGAAISGLSNNNWGGSAAIVAASAQVAAFALPAASLDAVVLATLQPGGYSVQVSGVNGASGLALVEIYDVDSPAPYSAQKVMNISTRGNVGPGAAQLLAGFSVSGTTAKKVLIRGVGPTLSAAPIGLSGALADPILSLVRLVNGTWVSVRENDNWEVGNDTALVAEASAKVGAFPLQAGSRDAVILLNLPPGTYTAQLFGPGTSSGIALVEVYEVP